MKTRYHRPFRMPLLRGMALWPILFLFIITPLSAEESDVLTVQTAEGKLYAQPVKIAPVIEMLERGAKVLLLHQKGEWYAVSLPDQRLGWAHQSTFMPDPSSPPGNAGELADASQTASTPEAEPPGRTAVLKVASGRVRNAPSMDGGLTFGLTLGDRFQVLAKQGDWYHIQAQNGRKGWIYHTLVEFAEPDTGTAEAGEAPAPPDAGTASSPDAPAPEGGPPPERDAGPATAEAEAADDGADSPASDAPAPAPTAAETDIAPAESDAGGDEPRFDVVVKVRSGRVRSGPSTASPTAFGILKGTRASVTGTDGSWYNIRMPDGRTGWAHITLFEVLEEEKVEPPQAPGEAASPKTPPPASEDLKQAGDGASEAADATDSPGEDPANEIEAIRFETTPEGHETIVFELNSFNPPKTYTIDDEASPKVVCEFADTRLSPAVGKEIPTSGKLVRALTVISGGETASPVRVEASLDPRFKYSVDQVFFRKNNHYIITFKK